MSDEPHPPPQVFHLGDVTDAALRRITRRDHCACLVVRKTSGTPLIPKLHVEPQNERAAGWGQIVQVIAEAARTGEAVLEPSARIAWEAWIEVLTLPPQIGSLTEVKEFRLYGSHLQRLPVEIGRMSSLQNLDLYTSYSLHWLPYEITRCRNLTASRMSTRAFYGNRKNLLPFPPLSRPIELPVPATCSVCDRPFGESSPRRFWTTQPVGTDIVPLLVHSCSASCIDSVPSAPSGFFARPHEGGNGVGLPVPLDGFR